MITTTRGIAYLALVCALAAQAAGASTAIDGAQAWLGLAVIVVVLAEVDARLLRAQHVYRPRLLRVVVRGGMVAVACAAGAVVVPLHWWLLVMLVLGVLQGAFTLRQALVVLVTVASSVVVALLPLAVPPPSPESMWPPLSTPLAMLVAVVVLPSVAVLAHGRVSAGRRALDEHREAVQRLQATSVQLRRSQSELRRWNDGLRQEVERQTSTLEERNRNLSIINAVSFALAEPMDNEQALGRALRLVARLLGVRAAQAYTGPQGLAPRFGQTLSLFVPVAPEDVHAPRVPEALLRAVAMSGRPVSSDDAPSPESAVAVPLPACEEGRPPSALPDLGEPYHVVPLVAKGRILGSFAVVGGGALSNDDDGRHLLLLVGRELGIALENACLYQAALEEAAREAFLMEVSRMLNGTERADDALPAVLEAFRSQVGADEVMLVTLPEESRDILIAGTAHSEHPGCSRSGTKRARLDRLARALVRQVSDRPRPLVLGVGGESPLSDQVASEGVATIAVGPIYLRRGHASEVPPVGRPGDEMASPAPMLAGALMVAVGAGSEWGADCTGLLERVVDILAHRIQADEFVAVQRQRIRELTGLAEVARTMQSGADDERLHEGFAMALRRLMRYEALYVVRVDESLSITGLPSFAASGRPAMPPAFLPHDSDHPWFALRSPLLWTRGMDAPPAFLPDDVRYAIVVPMRPKGQMLGLSIVAVPRPVRSDQLRIIEQAVEQLALALDAATLYQQATARASHIQALSNLARIVASVVNLREAFSAFSEEVRWLIPFDCAVMFLLDETETEVSPYASYPDDYPDDAARSAVTTLVRSIASVPIEAGAAVAFRRDDPRYAHLDWSLLDDHACEVAAVPIRHGGRTTAVFALVANATSTTSTTSTTTYDIGDLDALDEVAGLLAVTIDRIRLYEQADHSAKHDLLTGLPNYRYLQERLHALELSMRAQEADPEVGISQTAALVIDMDNLKVFNDTLGHEVGDRAIQEVASVLQASCRRTDFVARTGGDEFVVLMEWADAEAALTVADRIHGAVHAIDLGVPCMELRVGVSIGIAAIPDDVGAFRELLHAADQAMYDAKFAGGQRTRLARERGGAPEPRALRGRSVRLADTLIRSLVAGGSSEELAALSLAQRWAGGVVGQLGLSPDLLPQVRLVLASAASRRFESQRTDREQSLARYLVDRIEEDWEMATEDGTGEQLTFLVRALLDVAWMTMPRPSGAGLSLDEALRGIEEAHPSAGGTAAWSALVEVSRKDAARRRAA